jgi:hypothetical protein
LFAILLGSTAPELIPWTPKPSPVSASVIAFGFFLFVGRFLPGPAGPQGDEPHYLLIAESLIHDGDLDLKNQFDERAFSRFTSANLEPHTAPRSPQGTLYAIHTPGLAALIAPGFALFGYAGAKATISLAMALVVGLMFFTTRSLVGEEAANFVFLVSTFASPLPIYANSLFPDPVAALPLALTLAFLANPRTVLLALSAFGIALLPWLHPRFLPLGILLALSIVMRGRFSLGRAAATLAPLFVSVVLLLLHFQSIFGSLSLAAAYGPGFSTDVSLTRIPWGVLALLLDRQFGLLLFAPLFLLAPLAVPGLWKNDRTITAVVAGVIGVAFAVGGSFSMWWGGASPPARFLVAALPAFFLLCGSLWRYRPERRRLLGMASGFGVGLLSVSCLAPRALHNRGDTESGLLRLLAPDLDLDRIFPGFVNASGIPWLCGLWGAVLIAIIFRPKVAPWASLLTIVGVTVFSDRPLLDPFPSTLRALESWNDHRRTFGGADSEADFSLEVPLGREPWDLSGGSDRLSPRFSLPGGSWTLRVEARVEMMPGALNVARVSVVGDDPSGAPLASAVVRAGESEFEAEFILAQDQRRLRLRGEGLQSTARILRVLLTPEISGTR